MPTTISSKSRKTRAKSPRRKRTALRVSDLILSALRASSARSGLSLAALKKNLKARGYDVVRNKNRVLAALKRLIAKKTIRKEKIYYKLTLKRSTRRRRVARRKTATVKKATRGRKRRVGVKKSTKRKRRGASKSARKGRKGRK